MKRVTKNNLLKFIDLQERYMEADPKNKDLLQQINHFIEQVINRDKRYYSKLSSYHFDSDQLKFLL